MDRGRNMNHHSLPSLSWKNLQELKVINGYLKIEVSWEKPVEVWGDRFAWPWLSGLAQARSEYTISPFFQVKGGTPGTTWGIHNRFWCMYVYPCIGALVQNSCEWVWERCGGACPFVRPPERDADAVWYQYGRSSNLLCQWYRSFCHHVYKLCIYIIKYTYTCRHIFLYSSMKLLFFFCFLISETHSSFIIHLDQLLDAARRASRSHEAARSWRNFRESGWTAEGIPPQMVV